MASCQIDSGIKVPFAKLVAVIICCFVTATGYIAFVIAERQTALQKFARYNDSWAVSQTVAEYLRLQNKLAVLRSVPVSSTGTNCSCAWTSC